MFAELSAAGEQYVDQEIKRTLLGVKQVKEMMVKKEEKHRYLMDALRHSSDKKKVNSVCNSKFIPERGFAVFVYFFEAHHIFSAS